MPFETAQSETPAAIRIELDAIFVSLELSKSTWLMTSLSPGAADKMSRHSVAGGDVAGLLMRIRELRSRALARTGKLYRVVSIHEAGLDGFWLHRSLDREEWFESHIVDAASIAVSRKRRRVKTDRIDGETLIRTLLAYRRGEPRVCSMVRVPSPQEEDRRRVGRERKVLVDERTLHINRIKGLLFSQGIRGYEPGRRDRRERLEELRTGDGRDLPRHIKAQVLRELGRLELVIEQIKAVEAERDAMLSQERTAKTEPATMLLGIKGIGPEFANIIYSECLSRTFDNRRQVASYAGLAASPWQSGSINREQGISKAGNPRLRTAMVQLAWLWLRHQPNSMLSRWFQERVKHLAGKRKAPTIVALARKLLVAFWKYVTFGVLIEGATINAT